MNELIQPFSNTNIDWFVYGQFHLDENQACDKVFVLDSKLIKTKWLCENAVDAGPEYLKTMRQLSANEESYLILPKQTTDCMMKNWPALGIVNSITMYKRHPKMVEFFEFTSTYNYSVLSSPNNRIDLKNIDLLSKIKSHLGMKVKDLDLNYKITLDFPNKMDFSSKEKINTLNLDFLTPYNHSFNIDNKKFNLNKSEWECWRLLALGQTAKTIGSQLNITHRTAEFYINSLKQKTEISDKSTLAWKFYKHFKEWL
ncbi:MAG: LuxR C-terminal-related transcriptional regulator [Candidatus Paracaedibacteraceae bacterium]|nr:LuxR C-terminal-related transcriptional regulator [Candidatus Paracaedibacteraceae bacterium]